ncbi:Cys-tRNA(Pro) deacylase [Pseudoalteromonas shioyasakiensis]|uniref:Cys-tRNA(Pro) deacylase n=1 Tax=Pseudoalteromonas shioyasakiensis TaxID=1190813 RepID=UPI0021179F15|nr:Cys-tRNA(Pro) deacylase [Pseudoalteromonas shioyasakiensis]MCQ8878502.1 Cys-tRNA(Pro) deacylase [Pseudoalteromonas shioyasakiensis]
MTPAIVLLEQKKVEFEVLSYQHDPASTQFGLEAVTKLNLNAQQVFKTLILENTDNQLIVAVTPVAQQVNLKQLAKACGVKKVHMAAAQKVQNSTGYILGGVSPLGQKKRLKTFIHKTASQFDVIYVSAGKRGLEIALSPNDLITLSNAQLADF